MTGEPNQPSLAGTGSRTAEAYDRWFERRWGRYAFSVEARAVSRAADVSPGDLVLDVGCGTGRFATAPGIAPAGPVGVDLDENMVRIACDRLHGRCLQAPVEALPFRDSVFDVALVVTVLEFVADPAAALTEVVRVTRPGGRVVVGALNPHSPWGLANRRRLRRGAWCDARFLNPRFLRALGSAHGRTELHAVLYAPGPVPGLRRIGPALERLGHHAPRWGAFQVMAVTLPTRRPTREH